MPVSICPRCKHVNPEYAAFCHFDGVVLHAQPSASSNRLPSDFIFPTGRRCGTFDELVQGCQEEWSTARNLLLRGAFALYFQNCKRDDLVRAANDARAHPNPDIALTTFLNALPGTRTQTPKLDLNPRRILLGNLQVGETRTVPLSITNEGQSMLQGTITVTEGQDWLSLSATARVHEAEVAAVRDQVISLTISPRGLAAGQTYGAKLTVVTNGGIVEVPLRMDLVAQPFAKVPFQGVCTQRELADRMRRHPKESVPILESGEVQKWFQLNGWTYPVSGTPVKGVGGVQQFFEGMGVSKPPPVALSMPEARFKCAVNEKTRGQVTLQTNVKKWVYAQVASDSAWLRPIETQVAGPQHVAAPFEIDTRNWTHGRIAEGKLTLQANGGQLLTMKVIVEVQGAASATPPKPAPAAPAAPPIAATAPPPTSPAPPPTALPAPAAPAGGIRWLPAFVTTLLICLGLRIALIPFVDCLVRTQVAQSAASKLGVPTSPDSTLAQTGGWLTLPWPEILSGEGDPISASHFHPGSTEAINLLEFRHYFVSYFIRWFVFLTFWLGGIAGAIAILRRGGVSADIPWGIIAGLVAGLGVSATAAAIFLTAEMIPHVLWRLAFSAHGGPGYLVLWTFLATACWLVLGVVLGLILPWIGPVRRMLIDPAQRALASAFRRLGLTSLAATWTP